MEKSNLNTLYHGSLWVFVKLNLNLEPTSIFKMVTKIANRLADCDRTAPSTKFKIVKRSPHRDRRVVYTRIEIVFSVPKIPDFAQKRRLIAVN